MLLILLTRWEFGRRFEMFWFYCRGGMAVHLSTVPKSIILVGPPPLLCTSFQFQLTAVSGLHLNACFKRSSNFPFQRISYKATYARDMHESMRASSNSQHQTLEARMSISKEIAIRCISTPANARKAKRAVFELRHRVSRKFSHAGFCF